MTKPKYPLLLFFSLFLLIFSAALLLKPQRIFSELENRYLTRRPAFTLTDYFRGKFSADYEKYCNDQFPLRDQWITLKSAAETAGGKLENNGIVKGKDGYLFEKRLSFDQTTWDKNAAALLAFLRTPGQRFTAALVPSSYEILQDKLPMGTPEAGLSCNVKKLYSSFPTSVHALDLFQTMREHSSESIYYRTDPHWTAQGAYLAYQDYCNANLLYRVSLKNISRTDYSGFYGSYFSRAKFLGIPSDAISCYEIPVEEVLIDGKNMPGLYQIPQFSRRDKYAGILYGNNGLTIIRSRGYSQKNPGELTRILLIKDSFGNSIAPFLAASYDEVVMIDLRHFSVSLKKFLAENRFDDILILYGALNFSSDSSLYKLGC